MPRWEYLFVTAELFDYAYRPRTINDREERDWFNGPTIASFSNELGAEGWELISVAQGQTMHLIFKRLVG